MHLQARQTFIGQISVICIHDFANVKTDTELWNNNIYPFAYDDDSGVVCRPFLGHLIMEFAEKVKNFEAGGFLDVENS